MLPGSGKFEHLGLGSDRDCKESTDTAFNFLKQMENASAAASALHLKTTSSIIRICKGIIGMTGKLALPTLIALCSNCASTANVKILVVLGEIKITGVTSKGRRACKQLACFS